MRVEPWSVVFTELDTGAILDVVDGPRAAAVKQWLRSRPRWWRKRVELVAIDMSSEFRSAVREVLPKARISVDHWHVIRLANQMLTDVRRRRAWEVHGRRGRMIDPPWRYRKLLTCAGDRLTARQRKRLHQILEADIELGRGLGHRGTRTPVDGHPRHRSLPAGLDRTREGGAGHQTRGAAPAVQDPVRLAPGVTHLLPHPDHKRSH